MIFTKNQPVFLVVKRFANWNSVSFLWALILCSCLTRCSEKDLSCQTNTDRFVSAAYNHFEYGVLFTDWEFGLEVLWKSSFKNGRPYKENVGFFVTKGLLISPNIENTPQSAKLSSFQRQVIAGKLYVLFEGNYLEVFGIIHTHPEGLPIPSPRNDYQYGYLGIHNYVMSHHDLYDAYKNAAGEEISIRLGTRKAYEKLPFKEGYLIGAVYGKTDQNSSDKIRADE